MSARIKHKLDDVYSAQKFMEISMSYSTLHLKNADGTLLLY